LSVEAGRKCRLAKRESGLPEGVAFTPDGKYLFVGNYLDQDLSILKVNGTEITDTGKRFKLPGHPASVRMSTH
jgi:DNA-binding beta-propeller fold protein YncE